MKLNKTYLAIISALGLLCQAQAGVIYLEDFATTVYEDSTPLQTGIISALWGYYSEGTFTPIFESTPGLTNTGYIDLANDEVGVALTLGNNDLVPAGSQLWIAVYDLPEGSTYSNSAPQAILTDASWLAPTFTVNTPFLTVYFTENTVADFGGFDYNGGSPVITTTVPEPGTWALISLGLGATLWRMRRLNKAMAI